jgi:hypothetical protein
MNDTREIMTLEDSALDVVSGGFFNANGLGSSAILNVLSNNHQTQMASNNASVGGGGGNTILAGQFAQNNGLQIIVL